MFGKRFSVNTAAFNGRISGDVQNDQLKIFCLPETYIPIKVARRVLNRGALSFNGIKVIFLSSHLGIESTSSSTLVKRN